MENKASFINFTDEEVGRLRLSLLGLPIYHEGYSPVIRIFRGYKTSYDIFLQFLWYLNSNPRDHYVQEIFHDMYNEDIGDLPLFINHSEVRGEVANWRLSTGK